MQSGGKYASKMYAAIYSALPLIYTPSAPFAKALLYRTAAFPALAPSPTSPNAAFSAQVQIPLFGAPRRNRRGAARAPHCASRNAAKAAAFAAASRCSRLRREQRRVPRPHGVAESARTPSRQQPAKSSKCAERHSPRLSCRNLPIHRFLPHSVHSAQQIHKKTTTFVRIVPCNA